MRGEKETFGQRLRAYRLAARLSQQELAEKSGLSIRAVSDLERGHTRQPFPNSVSRLAAALQLKPAEREEFAAIAARRLGQPEHAADTPPSPDTRPSPDTPPPTGAPSPADAESRVVPRQLPAPVGVFVGRRSGLGALSRIMDKPGGTGIITAIGGMAGVGKTALAVRWAHEVADRFPDGQLYVNLRGYDADQPVSAIDALAGFLRALGMPAHELPPGLDERAAAYRSRTADRRMLVVLDNAARVEQVRPLLPGAATCVTVVTSRDTLAGLVARDGAERIELDVLSSEDAVTLLRQLGGAGMADDAAVATLADRCCRLPLALRVAAELAAARPTTAVAELAAELADVQHRLDVLEADGDSRTAVRAVFSWSYRHLDTDIARAFRRLALHPGADFDRHAVAALTGTDPRQAARLLDRLARAHLIQRVGTDRYGMHDLLRAYARDLADTEDDATDRHAALAGLYAYYLYMASTAANTLFPAEAHRRPHVPAPATPVPDLTAPTSAATWLAGELANLVAAAAQMTDAGCPHDVIRLSPIMFRYLDHESRMTEALIIHGEARRAAELTGDRPGQAVALRYLGTVEFRSGRYPRATDYLHRSLAALREVGDQREQTHTVHNIGTVERHQGRYAQALDHFQQALALSRATGDWLSEVRAMNSIGIAEAKLGRFPQAADHLEQARNLWRTNPARNGGHEIFTACGEADALTHLGVIDMHQGRYRKAASRQLRALDLNRQMNDRRGGVEVLTNLGMVRLRQGRHEEATSLLQQVVTLCREIGDRHCEAEATIGLGLIALRQHRHEHATDLLNWALRRCEQIGDQFGQAEALSALAELCLTTGRPNDATTRYTAALRVADSTGDAVHQAHAHHGLAVSYAETGDHTKSGDHLTKAFDLFTALGMPEADRIPPTPGRDVVVKHTHCR
jgi:tetratricopeptide (TPR) repeat protein/transcriptional regulator with XRE-family HTH domain